MTVRSEIIRRLRIEIHALEGKFGGENTLLKLLRKQLIDHETSAVDERREHVFRRAAWDLTGHAGFAELGRAQPLIAQEVTKGVIALGDHLDQKYVELRALREITECMNDGQLLSEVMANAFPILERVVPYDRIGVSLIDKDSIGHKWVRLEWVQAKYDKVYLKPGHSAQLDHGGLQESFYGHEPFFINDLEKYFGQNPDSTTAALLLKEGVLSNLAYPLTVRGQTIGFIFFSSCGRNSYKDLHIDIFAQIARELSMVIDKCRTYEQLCQRNDFMKQMFGRYVTEEIAELVFNNDTTPVLTGQRCVVTVLFSDLRNFTSMAEVLPPELVVECLNTYLKAMTQVIIRHEGRVDSFIGDAILAVFGAPVSKLSDAARAVACAIEMENKMLSVNAELKSRNLPELTMGIGLNTGEVVAGNIGSDLRAAYSVIGNPVNIASRVSSIASKGQILATETTFNEVQDIVEVGGSLKITIKGINDPIRVFDVTAINGLFNIRKWSHPDSLLSPAAV